MITGYTYNFIFSRAWFYRAQRHLAFWLTRIFSLTFCQTLYNYHPGQTTAETVRDYYNVLNTFPPEHFLLEIFYCYWIVYWLVPNYSGKRKYRSLALGLSVATIILLLLSVCVNYYLGNEHSDALNRWLLIGLNTSRLVLIFGAPPVAVFFVAIQLFKNWYLRQEEKQMLVRANADAEIQLLKAQVHPHFFFNTLNNIYWFALDRSPRAGKLVQQLAGMMKYMIDECGASLVPLEKEIQMIYDYISLEEIRYGNQLDVKVEVSGEYRDKFIAPLLMIPLVENAFKHGASKMLDNPRIRLQIALDPDRLKLFIENNCILMKQEATLKQGIGLKNVEKRLRLLYAGQFLLAITPAANKFVVRMSVPVHRAHQVFNGSTAAPGERK